MTSPSYAAIKALQGCHTKIGDQSDKRTEKLDPELLPRTPVLPHYKLSASPQAHASMSPLLTTQARGEPQNFSLRTAPPLDGRESNTTESSSSAETLPSAMHPAK